MEGIVSVLEGEHDKWIRDLWLELENTFGVNGVYITPFPHFSYCIAPSFDTDKLVESLATVIGDVQPFCVRTSGLALFTGPSPVVYLPIVRSPELSALHGRLWNLLSESNPGMVDYYHPERWMPHITIGFGDISVEVAAEITGRFAGRDLSREIQIENLAYIAASTGIQHIHSTYRFGG